ncbi:MAG: hypothetical protein M0R40_06810 [Firmicutes bacterium]|nr:hypothetical protein [Bacillota bacterium]
MMKYTFTIPEDTKQIIELETGMKIEEYLEKVRDDILGQSDKPERLSVIKAAKLMGVNSQCIRVGLQRGILPFGWAIKTSDRYTYYISPKKFTEYTGIETDK